MHIAVCDDNKLFLDEITDQLRKLSQVEELSAYSELSAFLQSVDSGKRYHAVLLDIDWNQEEDGMSTAEYLYQKCPETKIIYVTGYNDRFSQDIFLHKSNLSGYLTKPVDPARLKANLEKIADSLPGGEVDGLMVRSGGAYVSISAEDILFIESRGHNIIVHTETEEIMNYRQLDYAVRRLPAYFFQCHKSYLVNLNQIRRLQPDAVVLKNGALVPVSRSRYRQTKEAYFRYIGRNF